MHLFHNKLIILFEWNNFHHCACLLSTLNRSGRSQQEIPKEEDPQAPNSRATFDNLRCIKDKFMGYRDKLACHRSCHPHVKIRIHLGQPKILRAISETSFATWKPEGRPIWRLVYTLKCHESLGSGVEFSECLSRYLPCFHLDLNSRSKVSPI